MENKFYVSVYGRFIIRIDKVKFVDTDSSKCSMSIYYSTTMDNEEDHYFYYVYSDMEHVQNEVVAIGKALKEYHENKKSDESGDKPQPIQQEKPSDTVDSLEV